MEYLKSRIIQYNFWIQFANFDSIKKWWNKILFGSFYMMRKYF